MYDNCGKEAEDVFSTEEEALYDFYLCYAEKSRKDNLEYFTFIKTKKVGKSTKYYYENVTVAQHDNCVKEFISAYILITLFDEEPVIMVHTHPQSIDDPCRHYTDKGTYITHNPVGLSPADISLTYLFRVRKVYAVLPDGRVYGAERTGLFKTEEIFYDFSSQKNVGGRRRSWAVMQKY